MLSPEPVDREAAWERWLDGPPPSVAAERTRSAFDAGFDAAMAAADEREATLKRVEAERDLALAEADECETERSQGVHLRREREREAAREVRALTEALEKIIAAHDEEAGLAFGDDLEAHVLSLAREALAAVPVPVAEEENDA